MFINQRNPSRAEHGTGYYLALTFGTLLSSQGADAHDFQPISWPCFATVCPLYTGLRSSRTSGVRPAVSQALRPGPFSLGAGRTLHGFRRACTGGSPGAPEAPEGSSGHSRDAGGSPPSTGAAVPTRWAAPAHPWPNRESPAPGPAGAALRRRRPV